MTLSKGDMFPVLDHGFVKYIDSMGSDESIEENARQSYGSGTRKISQTRGLIRRLVRDRHDSPTESVDIAIQIKCPIFVARQILRHRLFSVNEMSGRYSIIPDEYYVPDLSQICYQDKKNKQGRSFILPTSEAMAVQSVIREMSKSAFENYNTLLNQGVARETARVILPQNTYTTFTIKGNLRTWLHFLHLRMDPHAQWETRAYANEVAKIVQSIAPIAYEAWEEYTLYGSLLSRTMRRILGRNINMDFIMNDSEFIEMKDSEKEMFLESIDYP